MEEHSRRSRATWTNGELQGARRMAWRRIVNYYFNKTGSDNDVQYTVIWGV